MNPRRLMYLLVIIAMASCCLVGSASAAAAPVWDLGIHHNETNFAPGAGGESAPEYWFSVENVGSSDSSGPVTLTITLPDGLTRREVRQANTNSFNADWSCPGAPGDTAVICTTTTPIPHHAIAAGLVLSVTVAPSASGIVTTEATLSGGGAPTPVSATEPTTISSSPAPFGIVPLSVEADFLQEEDQMPVRMAGSHPDLFTLAFDFNSIAEPVDKEPPSPDVPENKAPSGNLRDLRVDFPPGFTGYPAAVGECKPAEFLANACPPSSQVGRIDATTAPISILANTTFTQFSTGVFNMEHPKGVVSDLAFQVANNPIHVRVSLDPSRGYAIRTRVTGANETLPVFFQKMTLWGVPADSSHNYERCPEFVDGGVSNECSAGVPPKSFLSLPSQCDGPNAIKIGEYDSWQNIGSFGPEIEVPLGQMTDCDQPGFDPSIAVWGADSAANTPSGLTVGLHVPQSLDPSGQATPPVKSVRLELPEGMTVSPAFAAGLKGCSEAEIGLGNADPVACPAASRVGSVSVQTPVLDGPVEGSLYMAEQGSNPFGAPLAVYLALHDTEERGILLKIAGRLDLDDVTGQITVLFDELPQLPFEDVSVQLLGGDRAPLLTPSTCGSPVVHGSLTSWAEPGEAVGVSDDLQITRGANGGPCPNGLQGRPFAPTMNAGTLNPVAGSYSPFVFRLNRKDEEQELARLDTTLPPGLTAKLAGIPYCSESAISAISAAEGAGGPELAKSSCPAESRMGSVDVGVGAGTSPAFFSGQAYLAGPYKEAPLSLAIVVPAVIGPFDFGNVVVRAGIRIDPRTAAVSVISDPFPTVVHGVLLRIQDVRLRVDRPHTTLNPTSCDRMAVNASVFGAGGGFASLASPFQVGRCMRLGFKPRLSLRLKGGTKRTQYPALRATLKARRGDANIDRVSVALPHSEFLAQEHINTICTRVQFAADICPRGSIYGYARAVTPLLDKPLKGPVYLRSSSHRLPDLVADLRGQFEITLVGHIDSKNQGIRATFSSIPDAPVSAFTLKMSGGRKGLLVNSRNLCARSESALVKMVGHNGKTSLAQPRLATKC